MTTITIDRATVEQALEALDEADAFHRNLPDQRARRLAAMAALRAALAQQAEPVSADPHTTTLRALLECCLSWEPDACVLGNVTARQAITALRAALAQQDEPAQAISECIAVLRPMVKGKFPHEQALDELVGYTASPQRVALQTEPAEPVAWSGYNLDGMVEAFSRVVEAHYQRANPFQNPIDMDAQMALRALRGFIPAMKAYTAPPQRKQAEPAQEPITRLFGTLPVHDTQQALAQQAEPDHETRAELAEQQVVQLAEERDHYRNLWQKAQQAEPAQAQRCRAEPRSDGDYACDCKIGACPGRSAEPVAWTDRERRVVRFALKCFISQALDRHAAAAQDVRRMWFKPGDHLKFYQDAEDATSALTKMGAAEPLGVPGGGHLAAPPADNHSPQG